ncbi:hypothetical protein FNU76_07950 [Chitinimonas arctica]|uniref:EAL domain-containing protein n=1 Tax=Chitinimonas arctica TaxID=2594795 RepID=A0A516SDS7_9NEIS|nr:hypothetical protein [Chitinimonas arctica]QDQ26299.1 hypothetical protein FNU76_07950 [Chitinimonas arctica]
MGLEPQRQLSERIASLPAQWVAGFPLVLDESGVVGRFFKCELRSRFDTLQIGSANLCRARLVALGPDGEPFPSERLFRLTSGADGLLKLDRLCRLIHALNYFIVAEASLPLVLPIHPRLFEYVRSAHGHTFARMLAHFDLSPSRIVLETPGGLPQATLDGFLSEGFAVHVAEAVCD